MTSPLLTTKLSIPPLRCDVVHRPRLIERLDEALQPGHRLTLVSAPAGFGKTTLVAAWLRHLQTTQAAARAITWLSLEEGESDPTRFFTYLVVALQVADPAIGQAVQGMLQSPQPVPPESLLSTLINDIAATSRPFVLVLDDYHLIKSLPVHQQLSFLVEHQPSQMHLVIATREDPPLPLARLRARGQVVELRQTDLQFTPEETSEFLRRAARVKLSATDVGLLHQRTEGWIVGLQLAAQSMRHPEGIQQFLESFAGSNRFVLDYLIEEVFGQQPAGIQDFLLKTSILDRFTVSLCGAVTEKRDCHDVMLALEQANLFTLPLDESRQWYRYHHLFADVLRHRLQTERAEEMPGLHRRASQWYADHGFFDDAVRHALAASDWEHAARLIGRASEGMLKRGEIVTLIGWCNKLPEEIVHSQPPLSIAYAWALILASQYEPAETILDHAERSVQNEPLLLGGVAAAQAYLARAKGDNPRLIQKSEQALSLLPETDLAARSVVALNLGLAYWHAGRLEDAERVLLEAQEKSQCSGNDYALLSAQVFLARTLATRGKLRQAAAMCQQLLQDGGHVPILAIAHYDLCTVHYEWNDLQKAGEHLHHGMGISTYSGNVEFQNAGRILRAFLWLAQGDSAGALEAVEKSHALTRDFPPAVRARSAACHVRIALALGDLETAQRWGEQLADHADAHSFYRFLGLARPLLLIAQGRKDVAAEQLKTCYATASQAGWGYAVIAVRVLQSLAAESLEGALEFLGEALRLAQPEGFIRTFADAGEPLAPLLREAALRGILPEYVGQILAAIKGGQKKVVSQASSLVEPLSERELEVLRLVVAGLSNREIAEKLVISPGTAKTHIHNLCGKLGVRNRTEAATKAKELNLV